MLGSAFCAPRPRVQCKLNVVADVKGFVCPYRAYNFLVRLLGLDPAAIHNKCGVPARHKL